VSIKKEADEAIEYINDRMDDCKDSRFAQDWEVHMCAMSCRIDELEKEECQRSYNSDMDDMAIKSLHSLADNNNQLTLALKEERILLTASVKREKELVGAVDIHKKDVGLRGVHFDRKLWKVLGAEQ